jgi:hypothetical protein
MVRILILALQTAKSRVTSSDRTATKRERLYLRYLIDQIAYYTVPFLRITAEI